MSDNERNVAIAIAFALVLGGVGCTISDNWRMVEIKKVQLEREKAGLK